VTLKLAMSLDGRIALANGESRWITGEEARRDVHEERAKADMILVGRGTWLADKPSLDVRIEGKEHLSPRRAMLTRGEAPEGWTALGSPEVVSRLHDVNDLLVEGGAGAAAAFLAADLVDRLIIYRAPILIGEGKAAVGDIGLSSLEQAHGRWRPVGTHMLGIDRREVYERART
jgi:diaminohydroxyphosphoribosylaminopyrimidine deaminase/5-amino-6-(5-phosphoribosylamino)uracil reductase